MGERAAALTSSTDAALAAATGFGSEAGVGRALQQAVNGDGDSYTNLVYDLDMLFLLLSAFLVFFMQCGFALLEAGTVRPKNVKNILLKNVIDVCIGAFMWWMFGFAFSYGGCNDNGFVGTSNFFMSNSYYQQTTGPISPYNARWIFSWAFSSTATTIVSGSVAERLRFRSYLIYTVLMTAWVYPVISHWVWSDSGWLSSRRVCSCNQYPVTYCPTLSRGNGLLDFAGSGVVHMTGGAAGLAGTIVLGPRIGRFADTGHAVDFKPASPSNQVLGVLILWFGWYGFNPGSTGCVLGCMYTASKAAVNTTLAGAAGGLTTLFVSVFFGSPGDCGPLLNGILAGLVSITAACAYVQSYAAVVIGIVGGLVYMLTSRLLLALRIDDPVDVVPVHYFCGAWGLVATGLFATETSIRQVLGYANSAGAFYGGGGVQLGIQLLGIVVITAWTFTLFLALFLVLRLAGWLRVSKEDEEVGLDVSQSIGGGLVALPEWMHRFRL